MFGSIAPRPTVPGKGRWLCPALLLAGLVFLAGQPARADSLDAELLKESNQILDRVYSKLLAGDRMAVGVLPFRVTRGKGKSSFVSAPICLGMTTRLEHALIMHNSLKPGETLDVLTHVYGHASRRKVGPWFAKPAERAKLFAHAYPVAWGKKTAKPGALLTGEIVTTTRRNKSGKATVETRVVIEAMFADDKNHKLVKVGEFKVKPDRHVFGALGYNFSLGQSAGKAGGEADGKNRDEAVAEVVAGDDGGKSPPGGGSAATPKDVGGLSVGIQYDGKPVEIKSMSEDGVNPDYYITPAEAGTAFTLTLTYNGKRTDKLGVVVKLNGRSTYQEEQGDSLTLSKWIYKPESKGMPDTYTGFTDDKGKVRAFKVLTAAESAALEQELGERAGWIDIDVFASAPPGAKGDDIAVPSASATPPNTAVTPKGPKEAQDSILKANRIKLIEEPQRREKEIARAGLIVPDEKATETLKLLNGKLPNPILVGSLRIRYYDPKK